MNKDEIKLSIEKWFEDKKGFRPEMSLDVVGETIHMIIKIPAKNESTIFLTDIVEAINKETVCVKMVGSGILIERYNTEASKIIGMFLIMH